MNETVFQRMMRWAKERDWSQTDLSTRLGLSPQNITNWKARGVPPDRYVFIAQLFGRSVDQLLGVNDDEGPALRPWPFPLIDECKFCGLHDREASKLEGAILLAAAQLGLDVKK